MAISTSAKMWSGGVVVVWVFGGVLLALGYPIAARMVTIALAAILAVSGGIGFLNPGPNAKHPRLVIIGFLLLVLYLIASGFAGLYSDLSSSDPAAFSERLSTADSRYFTLTIFTTTGFGDITADSEAARNAVSAQMVLGVVLAACTVSRLGHEMTHRTQ